MSDKAQPKKASRFPDSYVIVTAIMVIMVILTWIIPAGTYDFAEDGKTVLAGTFHTVERNGQGVWDFFQAFLTGMKNTANTIFAAMMVGGAFKVLEMTGTINTLLAIILRKTKNNYKIIIAALVIFMSLMGLIGVGNNVALAFVPIMLIMFKQLGLDAVTVVAAVYLGSNTGFSTSPLNPYTALLGQSIAGVTQMSGAALRFLSWGICTAFCIFWVIRYATKITKNPEKSISGVYDPALAAQEDVDAELKKIAGDKLTVRQILCLIILVAVFGVYAWGGATQKWDIPQLGAMMMVMTVATGIVGGMGPNKISHYFIEGCKSMTKASLLIGFAGAISVIMTNGKIIHTIVYGLSIPLSALPTSLAAVGMFIVNFFFNFFVSSGSGQCYIVMPLMAPLADVLGMTRQVAISAYQFGDGFSNAWVPTSGLMMGCVGAANLEYNKWLKFSIPYTACLAVYAAIFLIITTLIGWA